VWKKNGEKENDVRAIKETLKNRRVAEEMQRQPWYSGSVIGVKHLFINFLGARI